MLHHLTPEQVMTDVQSNNASRTAFNLLFGTHIPVSGSISPADQAVFYDLVGDPTFDEPVFLTVLGKAATLYRAIQASTTNLLNSYNRLYRTSLKSTGSPSAADRESLFNVAGDSLFNHGEFVINLPKANALLVTLWNSTTDRANYNLIFAASITSGGFTDADRTILFDTVRYATYVQTPFLVTLNKAANLYTTLQGSSTVVINSYNRLFVDVRLRPTGSPTVANRIQLFSIVSDPGYYQAEFLGVLALANSLLLDLWNSTTNRDNFNLLFGASIPPSGFLIQPDNCKILFDVAGNYSYDRSTFLPSLSKAASLYNALQSTTALRANYNRLFGTSIVATGAPTAANRTSIFDTTGIFSYVEAPFVAALPKAASLYVTLQGNAASLADFNKLYAATITATGAPSALNRTKIFDVAGGPSYNQSLFLSGLSKAASLYIALQGNASYRSNYNLLFGTTLAATGSPNAADRTSLFSVSGEPAFNQSTFLPVMVKTGVLLTTMRQNNASTGDLNRFNRLFGTTLNATATPSGTHLAALFGVAGDPNFNMAAFLPVLRKTDSLLTAIRQQNLTGNFNSKFSANLQPTVTAPTAADRGLLFSIAGDPNFNQAAFIAWLKS